MELLETTQRSQLHVNSQTASQTLIGMIDQEYEDFNIPEAEIWLEARPFVQSRNGGYIFKGTYQVSDRNGQECMMSLSRKNVRGTNLPRVFKLF